MVEIVGCVDAGEMAEKAAELVVRTAGAAVHDHGCFYFCLAGGRTPGRLYERLADWAGPEDMPWGRTEIFWGDERAVPLDHPDSNFGLAHECLLQKIFMAPGQIHAMPGAAVPVERGAEDYENTLRRYFQGPGGRTFDLTLLGVGSDGHTASLFPESPALEETDRMVLGVAAPAGVSPPWARLTLTLPTINGSGVVLFLAEGRTKQRVVREILSGRAGRRYPAARVKGRDRTIWFVDREILEAGVLE